MLQRWPQKGRDLQAAAGSVSFRKISRDRCFLSKRGAEFECVEETGETMMTNALSWPGGELRGTAKLLQVLEPPVGVLDFASASSGNGSSRASGGRGEGTVRGLTVVEGVEVSGPRDLCPFTPEHQAGGSFNREKGGSYI